VPTKFVYSSHSELRIKLDNLPPITQEVNQEYFKSLGYEVKGGFQSGHLKSQLIKENIDIAIWSFSNIEDKEDDDEGEKRESFSGLSIRVRNQSTLNPELEEEFKKVFEAYGLNPDFFEQAKIKIENREDVDLAPAIDIDLDSFEWGQALIVELIWLQNNNVISGLTDDDLSGISKLADKGTAGWNSKIRYFKGEWVQRITEEMTEEGMYMVRAGIDCGGFPAGLLLEEVPSGEAIPYHAKPFGVIVAYHEKALTVGIIIIIALIVGIVAFVLKKRRR
jgi:predicted lactoylglutathione lyase